MKRSSAAYYARRLRAAGFDAKTSRGGYSGRGMYGEYTPALILSDVNKMDVAMMVCPGLRDYRRDSLGKGMVWY